MMDGPESIFEEEIINGEKWIVISVQDNGIGWHWDDMPKHVREKYLKTKENIESVGGKFYYENIPKVGAKATIKVPSYVLGNNRYEC